MPDEIAKSNARLVAKIFGQALRNDLFENFAPVESFSSVKLVALLAL